MCSMRSAATSGSIRAGRRSCACCRALNEAVNEEWISDKTRFAIDGLVRRRLDRPYIRPRRQAGRGRLARGARARRRAAEDGPGRADRRDRRRSVRCRGDVRAEGAAGRARRDEPRLPPGRRQARSAMPRRLSVQHDDRRHRTGRCLPADRHQPALGSAARQCAAAQALSAGRLPGRGDRAGARPDLPGRDARRGRRRAERRWLRGDHPWAEMLRDAPRAR